MMIKPISTPEDFEAHLLKYDAANSVNVDLNVFPIFDGVFLTIFRIRVFNLHKRRFERSYPEKNPDEFEKYWWPQEEESLRWCGRYVDQQESLSFTDKIEFKSNIDHWGDMMQNHFKPPHIPGLQLTDRRKALDAIYDLGELIGIQSNNQLLLLREPPYIKFVTAPPAYDQFKAVLEREYKKSTQDNSLLHDISNFRRFLAARIQEKLFVFR